MPRRPEALNHEAQKTSSLPGIRVIVLGPLGITSQDPLGVDNFLLHSGLHEPQSSTGQEVHGMKGKLRILKWFKLLFAAKELGEICQGGS